MSGASPRPGSLRRALLMGILLPVLAVIVLNTVSLYRQALRAANIAYELVPGFTVTPEIYYVDNFSDDADDDSDQWGVNLRFQRNF